MPAINVTPEHRRQLAEDGAVKLEGMLNSTELAACRKSYDWAMANPTKHGGIVYRNKGYYNDATTLGAENAAELLSEITPLVSDGPFADICQQLWESPRVWFYDYELFRKLDGPGRTKSPFHQDTGYIGFMGKEITAFWICFEHIPKSSCLEIVRGSHLDRMYDGTPFRGDDDTARMYGTNGTYELPRLPDVEAQRAAGDVEILSWDLKPGDVVAFHPNALHGGGQASAACPERNTLVLRFFGDECHYHALPLRKPDADTHGLPKEKNFAMLARKPFRWLRNLKHGDPFHLAGPNKFTQVRDYGDAAAPAAARRARL